MKNDDFALRCGHCLIAKKIASPIDQRLGHPSRGYDGSTPLRSKHAIDKTRAREIRQIGYLSPSHQMERQFFERRFGRRRTEGRDSQPMAELPVHQPLRQNSRTNTCRLGLRLADVQSSVVHQAVQGIFPIKLNQNNLRPLPIEICQNIQGN